jgi:surface antigen
MNSAIFSNNGIDTSLTQMGPDWVRTQYSGGFQCTELANRYLRFKWHVTWIPRGNAGQWCDTMPPANSGLVQTTTPVHGDLMVLAGGSCGAAASTGHVVVVDRVEANGRLSVVEQNRANRGSYMPSCGKCFLHVVANDGSGTGGAGSGAAGSGMPVGGGAVPAAGAGPGGAGGAGGSGRPSMNGSAGMATPMQPPNPQQPTPQMPMNPMPGQPSSNAGAGSPVTPTMPAAMAGTSGAMQAPPSVPIPLNNSSSANDSGCSVAQVGGDHLGDVGSRAAWPALAFTALFVRGTRRRRA